VWIVLAAALVAAADVADRQTQTIPLPAGKTLSIDVTIGTVRIDGWDKPDVEIVVERRAPADAQLARVPLVIENLPAKVTVRAVQTDNTTDPGLRADVTVRVPRNAVIERVQVLEGRIVIEGFSGSLTADIRRGPIDGKTLSGTLRLEAGIGTVTLTDTRLSANGLLRLRSFNGDVRLTLAERPADARIMALALNGHVKSDIPLTLRDTWGPRFVTGLIEIKAP
jgi:DUF4097 and DUF4098 domain-containing protein YvlB